MLGLRGWALVGCVGVLAACGTSTTGTGSGESSSDDGSASETGSSCEPFAAVLVLLADESGSPTSADVSYSVAGGPFVPATCGQVGRCVVAEGYGQSITVRVTANGCSAELVAIGAADMCAGPSPELSFTVYDNCSGDPTSSGGYDSDVFDDSGTSSSEGDSSTSSSSDDTDGSTDTSSGSESSSSTTG
jgi:hypothetical protein